jgi:hypothetical protein
MISKELIQTKAKEHKAEAELLTEELNKLKESLTTTRNTETIQKLMIIKDRIFFHSAACAALEDLLQEPLNIEEVK